MTHELLSGHSRFKSYFAQNRSLFERLAQGQQPHTLLISCCDSRVPPELVLGTEPGELFVIRNVANIVPAVNKGTGDLAIGAGIEYVLGHLSTAKRVAILGHYGCGGVKGLDDLGHHISNTSPLGRWLSQSAAVLDKRPQESQDDGRGRNMVETVGQVANLSYKQSQDDGRWRRMVEWNVRLGLEHLLTYPEVRAAVAQGTIELVGLVYDWNDGEVKVLEIVRDPAARPFSDSD